MPATLESRVEIISDVFARPFDGELVVLDLAAGEYYGLDAIGARVWRGLEESTPLSDIVEQLLVEYEVERATLEADVLKLLADLEAKGLVRFDGGTPGVDNDTAR